MAKFPHLKNIAITHLFYLEYSSPNGYQNHVLMRVNTDFMWHTMRSFFTSIFHFTRQFL